MGNGTFRDTLLHTKGVFFCRARAFLTSAVFMIHVSGFIVLKHICGAQTHFLIFSLTFGVIYFCSELECDLVFAFFPNHAMYFGQ